MYKCASDTMATGNVEVQGPLCRPYLVGTAALAEYTEPSAGHQEEPYPGALPSCMGAYEMVELVAVGIHSELPLVSDSSESGHFHPTDHWKGEEASECFVGLQTHNMTECHEHICSDTDRHSTTASVVR